MRKLLTVLVAVSLIGCAGNNAEKERQKEDSKRAAMIMEKWSGENVDIRYEDFRGRTVRVQTLISDSELKEMRIRVMPAANNANARASVNEILKETFDYSAKRVCGKGMKSVNVVFEVPSMEAVRPTPFFDYRVEPSDSIKEYGFVCEY